MSSSWSSYRARRHFLEFKPQTARPQQIAQNNASNAASLLPLVMWPNLVSHESNINCFCPHDNDAALTLVSVLLLKMIENSRNIQQESSSSVRIRMRKCVGLLKMQWSSCSRGNDWDDEENIHCRLKNETVGRKNSMKIEAKNGLFFKKWLRVR